MVGKKRTKYSRISKFEAKLGLFTKLYVEAENPDKWLRPDEVWMKALADVIRSGNPDVGEVVSNTATLKAIVRYGADGTDEERATAIRLLEKILGKAGKHETYELVVKSVESDEIITLALDEKELAEEILDQMNKVVWSRENLRLFLIDLDACGKMFAGFSIDCAKKSGTFNVRYLTKCKMALGAMFRIYKDDMGPEGFGLKMLKACDEIPDDQVNQVSVLDNGLVFWKSKQRTKMTYVKEHGRKEYILDPVSRCLETALATVGPEVIDFFGQQELPEFPEALKKYILDSMVVGDDNDPSFNVTSVYMRYMLGVWTTLTNWKLFKIREIRAMNNGEEDDEQEAAIKSAASPGFAALRKEIRRGARFVSGSTSKDHRAMGPKNIAAAALGASYMDKKGESWVEDEADAKSFAMTALVEESNLTLFDKMGSLGNEVTEVAKAKLNNRASFGLKDGVTLTFESGEAVIMDETEEEVGLAVAIDDQLEGLWTVVEVEEGFFELYSDVHENLIDLIPQGDERKRVFVTSNPKGSDKGNNALYEELMKAQLNGDVVTLTRVANKDFGSNVKVPQGIVIGDKIVGVYRTPFVDQAYRDVIVDSIGNCKGKIERLFNFRSEDEGWITVVCLEKVELLSKRESMPNGLTNMIEVHRQEAIQKRKDDLAKAQDALAEAAAGIELY
jgi:hypothetical protein